LPSSGACATGSSTIWTVPPPAFSPTMTRRPMQTSLRRQASRRACAALDVSQRDSAFPPVASPTCDCIATERVTMATDTTATFNYKVVRQFTIMTVVWGIVGMLVGVIIAAELLWPDFLGGI